MKVKFIANPYHYLSYCLIPDYPITMYNRNGGCQFDKDGIFQTADEQLIKGIRAYINMYRNSCQIAEYVEGRKEVKDEPIVRETLKPVDVYEEQETRAKLVALLRL